MMSDAQTQTQNPIGRGKIAASQFPDVVIKPDGYSVHKPAQWR